MKLSKDNPIIRITRWLLRRKGLQRLMPIMLRFGAWPILYVYRLFGIKVLLLTTIGRKTGKPRTSPILYFEQGPNYIISAHQGGYAGHPNWYLNLMANPSVTVELLWRRRAYHAEQVADEAERKELLAQFSYGLVAALQEYTTRPIPVIRLRPTTVADRLSADGPRIEPK